MGLAKVQRRHLNLRGDFEFWQRSAEMTIFDSLQHKIDVFRTTGKVHAAVESLFLDVAWQQVMIGQGIIPSDYHPLADAMEASQLSEYHRNIKAIINQVVAKLPEHRRFIDQLHIAN